MIASARQAILKKIFSQFSDFGVQVGKIYF